MQRTAKFSSCKKYRYELGRRWDKGDLVLFILLNPSTADDKIDDPTIRRCIKFAQQFGFGGLFIGNLFAYRTPQPSILLRANHPVGNLNNKALINLASRSSKIIIAWGNHGQFQNRSAEVLKLLNKYKLYHFGLTLLNQPKHPLYLPATSQLQEYNQSLNLK